MFKELELFYQFAGLKVNYNKTEILRIGSLKFSDASFYSEFPLQWAEGSIKILGITVTADAKEMARLNYDQLIQKIENIFKIWSRRSTTLLGHIQIVNSLIMPVIVYRLQVFRTPDVETINRFTKVIIFMGRTKKVKLHTIN